MFEVQVMTTPGDGLFEGTSRYSVNDDKFHVEIKEISRVNSYGYASHCISSSHPHLSKFCYCQKQITEKEKNDESYMKVIMG